MAEEEPKDQPAKESAEKKEGEITGVSSAFDAADKLFEEMEVAGEEEVVKKKLPAETKEKPCKHCPEGKEMKEVTVDDIKWDAIDYTKPEFPLPIKAGKEVRWIENEKQYNEYASKGFDYTEKTQGIAEEKKEFDEKQRQLTEVATKMTSIYDVLAKDGKITPPTEVKEAPKKEVTHADIFEKFGIDEELADESEKRLVQTIVDQENRYAKMEARQEKLEDIEKIRIVREVGTESKRAAEATLKDFPLDDVIDKETSKNLTKEQFISILSTKAQSEEGQKRPYPELVRETIKELHYIQQQQKKTLVGEQVTDETPVEDFKAKHPGLYEKIEKAIKPMAVAEHEEETANVPPSLTHIDKDVETSKTAGKEKITGVEDAIDKGFHTVKRQ